MAEWATLKPNHSLRSGRLNWSMVVLPFVLGCLLARGDILGVHPFGVAYGGALVLRGERGFPYGLLGIVAGTFTLGEGIFSLLQIVLVLAALIVILPHLRKRAHKITYLAGTTCLLSGLAAALAMGFSRPDLMAFLTLTLSSLFVAGAAVIFWFALAHQEAVWRGEFSGEQGIAWLMVLIGVVSGLHGVQVANLSLSVVLISFFIMFAAERLGAGSASGVGLILGFLPQLTFDVQNLMTAGIYGLAGFCTGAFRRFGKAGTGAALFAVTLILTFFLREELIFPQLLSTSLGILMFWALPAPAPRRQHMREKPLGEVEAAVSKVRALADVLDQVALTYQAAEAEVEEVHPAIPDLMNVLVEKVCQTCPSMGVCWEREFYKTYHYLFDMFVLIEKEGRVNAQELPVEWKRHCGRLKEILLGIQLILEKEQTHEAWRRKFASNQESLSRQVKSVSEVIGNFAKELHQRHNWPQQHSSGTVRRHRHFLDVGIAAFAQSGQGISGDSYASLAFAPNLHAFILCDAMGAGEGAAKLSSIAMMHLEQLLETGFEPEGAVQALNSILVLRSPEESFVTIDMAIIDLETDLVKLIKAGAAPSYLCCNGQIEVLSTSSLPAGILNQIDLPIQELEMSGGDILIMVTDGVQDVLKDGTDWLKYFLEEESDGQAQELADRIVQEARRLSGGVMHDDGVVLVIRKNRWQE